MCYGLKTVMNICSLTKVKKRVKASVALETDLYAHDINVDFVSVERALIV